MNDLREPVVKKPTYTGSQNYKRFRMTGGELAALQKVLNLSDTDMAHSTNVGLDTLRKYKSGELEIPKVYVRLVLNMEIELFR